MNKRRLLKLADLLEADAKNKKGIKFDYWTTAKVEEAKDPISCGTSACAMGLAAISGAFKREGLGYRLPPANLSEIIFTWKGRKTDYDKAAILLFDISDDEANLLFLPGRTTETRGAVAERQVAKLIRDFVAGKVAP
jgi:hypothetical protein